MGGAADQEGTGRLKQGDAIDTFAKANGVTVEAGVPAENEVYADDTCFRAPTMAPTHRGGVDIEELDKSEIAIVPFDSLTGLRA